MMVNKFSKFMKSRKVVYYFAGNTKGSKRRIKATVPTCYECGKEDHIKSDCPVLKVKERFDENINQYRRKDRQRKPTLLGRTVTPIALRVIMIKTRRKRLISA